MGFAVAGAKLLPPQCIRIRPAASKMKFSRVPAKRRGSSERHAVRCSRTGTTGPGAGRTACPSAHLLDAGFCCLRSGRGRGDQTKKTNYRNETCFFYNLNHFNLYSSGFVVVSPASEGESADYWSIYSGSSRSLKN